VRLAELPAEDFEPTAADPAELNLVVAANQYDPCSRAFLASLADPAPPDFDPRRRSRGSSARIKALLAGVARGNVWIWTARSLARRVRRPLATPGATYYASRQMQQSYCTPRSLTCGVRIV
jgi:hypothetical protein